LQFDRAEFTAPAATAVKCASCSQTIIQSYYEAGGKTICSTCREALTSGLDSGGTARFLRALAVGLGAAVIGSIVWWGVRKLTGYEIGLISIAIGVGVGRAVHWGSRSRGGWAYQLLAVLLTYASIAGNYVPDVVTGITENAKDAEKSAVVAPATAGAPVKASAAQPVNVTDLFLGIGAIFLLAAAAPFLSGASNFIGLLIIGFGLWNAWKVNRRVDIAINGPYSVVPTANV
jgi:hypothetical protein